jgi:hypothetical protein
MTLEGSSGRGGALLPKLGIPRVTGGLDNCKVCLGQPYQATKGKRNSEGGGCKVSLSILGNAMPNVKDSLCSRETLVLFQNAKEVGIRFLLHSRMLKIQKPAS